MTELWTRAQEERDIILKSYSFLWPGAGCDPVPGFYIGRRGDTSVTIFRKDLDQLQKMPKWIDDARQRAERLRDPIGLHSVSLDGMPHGSGPHDKIGDLMPEILDAEKDLQNLEGAYWKLWMRVSDWIDAQEDLKASFILSLRYLDGMDWEKIADECNGTGDDPITGDAVRKYAMRYIKSHLYEDESNGQEG